MFANAPLRVLCNIVDGSAKQFDETLGKVGQREFRQDGPCIDAGRLPKGQERSFLRDDLVTDIFDNGQGDESFESHAGRQMRLDRTDDSAYFGCFGSALSCKFCVELGEPYPVIANNYSIEVSLVVDFDRLARMEIFGDEQAVENGDGGVIAVPSGPVETGYARIK